MYGFQPGRIMRDGDLPVFDRARRPVGFLARARGLLGTRSLEAGTALWFDRCSAIHMFGMRYAIDLVFLRAGKVVVLYPAVPPMCTRSFKGAEVALEMPLGSIERLRIEQDTALHFESSEADRP